MSMKWRAVFEGENEAATKQTLLSICENKQKK